MTALHVFDTVFESHSRRSLIADSKNVKIEKKYIIYSRTMGDNNKYQEYRRATTMYFIRDTVWNKYINE